MNEHTIKINFRIDELLEEHQLVIVRLVNHLASSGDKYKDNVIKRLDDITLENCLTFFEDDDFIEDNYMKMEKARYGVGKTEKEIEEELEFDEEITKKLKEIK